jgi:hypothetical protein
MPFVVFVVVALDALVAVAAFDDILVVVADVVADEKNLVVCLSSSTGHEDVMNLSIRFGRERRIIIFLTFPIPIDWHQTD